MGERERRGRRRRERGKENQGSSGEKKEEWEKGEDKLYERRVSLDWGEVQVRRISNNYLFNISQKFAHAVAASSRPAYRRIDNPGFKGLNSGRPSSLWLLNQKG